jgi:hypothetical protein
MRAVRTQGVTSLCGAFIFHVLEGNPGAQLDFASWRHRHGDGSKLRSIHEAVRRAQIYLVQSVEGFGSELEIGPFADAKGSSKREVQSLHRRTIDGVTACVAIRKRRGAANAAGLNRCAAVCVPGPNKGWPVTCGVSLQITLKKRVIPGTRNDQFSFSEINVWPRVGENVPVTSWDSNNRKALEGARLLCPGFSTAPGLDSATPKRYSREPVRQGSPHSEDIRTDFRGRTWQP